MYQDKPLLAKIEAARQAHAKSIGIPYVALKKPRTKEQREKFKQKKEKKAAKAAAAAAEAANGAGVAATAPTEAGLFSTMAPAIPNGLDPSVTGDEEDDGGP